MNEEMKQKVQEALKDKQTVSRAMKFCLQANLITQEQVKKAENNRSEQLKLMAKAVAWYLNRDNK